MIVYHASPNPNIKKLYDNSYVTMYPHIAYYMGLYYKESGKPWSNSDLKKPYGFEKNIYFKKGKKPDGIPTLYKLEIEPENIVMHANFPFEFQIKKGVNVTKIKKSKRIKLLNQSKQFLQLTESILFS
jgi:hypothetical protein